MTAVFDRCDVQVLVGKGEPVEPIMRVRTDRDPPGALECPGVGGFVLACGRCDAAIVSLSLSPLGNHMMAEPCGSAVVEVPVWARNLAGKRAKNAAGRRRP